MKRLSIILALLFFSFHFAFSQTEVEPRVIKKAEVFSVSAANQELDKINTRLATQELHLDTLKKAFKKIAELHKQSNECVEQGKKELARLTGEGEKKLAKNKFIEEKQKSIQEQIANCRAFVLRSKDTMEAYNETIQNLSASQLFLRTNSIWHGLSTRARFFADIKWRLSPPDGLAYIGFAGWKTSEFITTISVFIVSLLFSFWWRVKLKNYIGKNPDVSKISVTYAVVAVRYLCFILPAASVGIVLAVVFWQSNQVIELLVYLFLFYFLSLAIIQLLFSPLEPAKRALLWSSGSAKKLGFRLIFLSTLIFIGFLGYLASLLFDFPEPLVHLALSLYITLFSINLIWAAQVLTHARLIAEKFHYLRHIINGLLILLLLVIVVGEWLGYQNFSIYLVRSSTETLLLCLLAWALMKITRSMINSLNYGNNSASQFIRSILGVKAQKILPELSLVKVSIYLVILAYFITFFLQVWSISPSYVREWSNALINGVPLTGRLMIVPARLVFGLLTFSLIILLGRWLRQAFVKQQRFHGAQDAQIAMSVIISYIFFAIALIFSLLVAGVDFTGLAIIAGALSVGMGLGLQNVVNNFVSGLILLVEKPIKPGDRVIIGGTEGYVRKVSIRSTRISTLAHEDIIVPNADLVSKEVTNYMFGDQLWRVVSKVGVAYGSDIDLVKKTLLEVAGAHPEVIQDGDEKTCPRVLFRGFGDSSMNFELWCLIKDVNQKYNIESDLNFAINKAFRRHNITIAFPQRDVHIKK